MPELGALSCCDINGLTQLLYSKEKEQSLPLSEYG